MKEDTELESEETPLEAKKRFIWKWHPHGWLIALLILILIFVFRAFVH